MSVRRAIDRVISWKATPYLILIVISSALLLPIYWTVVTSFKPLNEVFRWPPTLWPSEFTLVHYVEALVNAPIFWNILNSTIYSLIVTIFVITIGTLTTYGFSMFPYRGSGRVAFAFLAIRVIPPQILWLPFIIIYTRLGLINSRPGVAIFEIMLVYPLSIWLIKGIFDSFPRELIDSASIDGASRIRTLIRIVVPVVAPAIGAVAIISFLWTWNEFMFPFLVLNNEKLYPITVGLHFFVGDEGIKWGPISASGVLAMLPGLVFFIFAQRYIIEGLTEGAVKQ
jgi:multiple sugar transport system permease protein